MDNKLTTSSSLYIFFFFIMPELMFKIISLCSGEIKAASRWPLFKVPLIGLDLNLRNDGLLPVECFAFCFHSGLKNELPKNILHE